MTSVALPHRATAGVPSTRDRVPAIDVTRYLALLGIMANHLSGDGLAARVLWDLHAIAFTWLIGVGTAYAIRRPEQQGPGRGGRGRAVAAAVLRAVVLAAAGWSLEELQAGTVAVVLVRLALITALLAPIALLPDRWLPPLAGALWLGGTGLGWWLMRWYPGAFDPVTGWAALLHPGTWPYQLFHPYYPVVPWLGVAVAGLWIGRRVRFDEPVALFRLGVGGVLLAGTALLGAAIMVGLFGHPDGYTLAVVSNGEFPSLTQTWQWLLVIGPYLPSATSLAFSTGIVMLLTAVIAACCLVLGPGNAAVRVAAIVGSMTFSGYFAHVLLTRVARWGVRHGMWTPSVSVNWLIQAVLLTATLWAWHRWIPGRLGKGPLEWASRAFAGLVLGRGQRGSLARSVEMSARD